MSNPDDESINENGDTPLLTLSSLSDSLGFASSSVSTVSTPTAAATANQNMVSTTIASATTLAPFTPTTNDEKEWSDFCSSVNVSPPKRINIALGEVRGKTDSILERSRLRCPRNNGKYTWDSLEGIQQAGIAFIINEGILDCFPQGLARDRRIAHGVLGINKLDNSGNIEIHGEAIWRDLHQFVRKRGDLITSTGTCATSFGASKYRQFRSDYKDLWGEEGERKVESCTMFSLNCIIEPVLRFQAESSMVCAFVVSSLMIHYRQVIHPQGGAPASGATASDASAWSSVVATSPRNQGSKQTPGTLQYLCSQLFPTRRRKARDSSTLGSGPGSPPASSPAHPTVAVLANDNAIETKAGNFTLNIGRYMRHNLTAEQKYQTIFLGMGFCFVDVMEGILKMSNANPPENGFLGQIDFSEYEDETPEHFYREVKKQLRHGALCCRIRLYEGYANKTLCVKEPEMNFTNSYHFVTMVGVSRTRDDNHGGIMFLAQDSMEGQPFKNISLELVREMQSTSCLYYVRHKVGIKMPNESVFDIKPEDIVTAGGLELAESGSSRRYCRDGRISKEEQKERKENQELLRALLIPDYKPEWARNIESNDGSGLNNDVAVVPADTVGGGHEGVVDADTVDEGEHEAIKVVEADTVEGEGIEVEYKEE